MCDRKQRLRFIVKPDCIKRCFKDILYSLKTVINFDERTSCPVPYSNNTHHIKKQFVILWSPLAKYMTKEKTNKGHAALAQHCCPTTPNIVGCYMLRSFAHPVFRCILQYFLPRKWKLPSVHERIINIRSDKGKPNVKKRSKMPLWGF